MKAKDLMSTTLRIVPPEMPVLAVAELLSSHGISAVPVVDGSGTPLGIVTEGDLIRRLADEEPGPLRWFLGQYQDAGRLAKRFLKAHGATARDVMTAELVTVEEDTPAEEIARLMEERRIKRVPVLRDDKIVGIVSRSDLLRAILRPQGQEQSATNADDSAILRAVLAVMRKQPWVDTFWTYPSVHDGVVTFYGYARNDSVRNGLRVMAQEIPGVTKVEDQLEPMPLILRATL
ncbi:CBS domain-containing protein [Belnapia rosea]|uniref:BON domain-containing protein n=1 Tax=Belnapia rosea TaxID=938405 RepID=A0A1G6T011_9PROT|nr:CBS domain-containing protein [Belnapia rosea]SDD21695.1 BON domain-containing protein [Belnapia rosea]